MRRRRVLHRCRGLDRHAAGDIIACDVTDQGSVDTAVAAAIARLGGGLDVVPGRALDSLTRRPLRELAHAGRCDDSPLAADLGRRYRQRQK